MFRTRNRTKRRAQTELNLQYPEHFFILAHGAQYRCNICTEHLTFGSLTDAQTHEGTLEHIRARRELDRPALPPPLIAMVPSASIAPTSIPGAGIPQQNTHHSSSGLSNVSGASWHSDLHHRSSAPEAYFAIPGPALPSDPPDTVYDLCGGAADQGDDMLSDEEMDAPEASTSGQPMFETGPSIPPHHSAPPTNSNIDAAQKRDHPLVEVPPPQIPLPDKDPVVWWPFTGRQECLLALMTAFPRAIFSGQELDVVRWFASKCNIPGMPANSTIQSRFEHIMLLLGLESELVQSKLGNYFAINSMCSILSNEMGNPLIRGGMVFYPQDNGQAVTCAANGTRWTEEVPPSLAAPMVRKYFPGGHHDYYIHEPFLASVSSSDGSSVVPVPLLPVRYFERSGTLFARSHQLLAKGDGYIIDGNSHLEIPLSSFLLPYPEFETEYTRYNLPSPKTIKEIHSTEGIKFWSESTRNPLRDQAQGKIIRSVPLWLYCDDTSGNVSKKWNKHNSFLFTLAGLPREQSQHPYNVHFLATSNIASPLEMLDKIAEELCEARANGIVAYDCEIQEEVLIIPWVYALQGDNPMQSEFSSHIGMAGKYFCRVCNVRGKDKDRGGDQESEIQRIREFLVTHNPRHVSDTVVALERQEELAMQGTFSVVDTEARKTGVKDKYFMAFVALMKEQCDQQPNLGSDAAKLGFLNQLRQELPERLYNPALFIKDLDVNQDTPVEILHVILLGIVKYFWRDAVARQNQEGREILKARINSLDVTGLGINKPQGTTLVQYAKSLTGGDFRVVMQIGPLILYDLLPPRAYATWIALSYLGPLAFQPEIDNVLEYLPRLETAINSLLQATVLWSPQWFNKPKFHVLLHLPEHIRRMGPAVLFATETFESYNFVIRLRSVHSNHQAPSHDIGRAFCRLQAVRFLVSGGWITRQYDPVAKKMIAGPPRQAGSGILDFKADRVFTDLMGMSHFWKKSFRGSFKLNTPITEVAWSETIASRCNDIPDYHGLFMISCASATLGNSDSIRPSSFALLDIEGALCPAKIIEIWVIKGSSHLAGLTVQTAVLLPGDNVYNMPSIRLNETFEFIQIERTQTVLQERQETNIRRQEVHHEGDLGSLILNAASLRSAVVIQALRQPPVVQESPDEVVKEAVTNWEEEKERITAEQVQKNEEKEKRKVVRDKKKADKEARKAEGGKKMAEKAAQDDTSAPMDPKPRRGKRKQADSDTPKDSSSSRRRKRS